MTTYLNYGLSDIQRAVEEGKEAEQHRIIKLLEEAKTYQQLEQTIALIKGETK